MKRSHVFTFLAVLLLSAGCDQAAKHVARSVLADASYSLAAGAVRFELTFNPGGFLSLGARLPEALRQVFFVGFVPDTLAILCALFLRSAGTSRAALSGLGLIAGGGLANWLDRVLNAGAVTDFVSLGLGPLRTGVFNVADVAVMAGAALLILTSRAAHDANQAPPHP